MEDFYPMPMFINLGVANLDLSVEWYQKALGFRVIYRQAGFIHLRRERYQDILLFPSSVDKTVSSGEGVVVQLQAGDISVSEIAKIAHQVGVTAVDGPVEQPWNVREVTVHDPDGYRLRFSEPINPNLAFKEVMTAE